MTSTDIMNSVKKMKVEDQIEILENIISLLKRRITKKARHSILELKGLGKEIWQEVNVEKYVEKERKSWI